MTDTDPALRALLREADRWFKGGDYSYADRQRFDEARETARAALAAAEAAPLIEWAEGKPETPAQWAYELALIISKARFGPGVDMGGKHNPRPSEQREARWFVDSILAAEAAPPPEYGRPPLDPATKAHDDAYMAGLIRGRELEREAAEAAPLDAGFVECPVCHEPERSEDMVTGVCLSCADAIAWGQNARRGAVNVP